MSDPRSIPNERPSEDSAELVPSRKPPGRYSAIEAAIAKGALFELLVQGCTITAAAQKLGMNTDTAKAWSAEIASEHGVVSARQSHIARVAAGLGYRALLEIVAKRRRDAQPDDDDPYVYPASVRAPVAKDLLRMAGHTEALGAALLDTQRAAALHELTEDQIASHIAAAQEALQRLQAPDSPNVTPDSSDIASLA